MKCSENNRTKPILPFTIIMEEWDLMKINLYEVYKATGIKPSYIHLLLEGREKISSEPFLTKLHEFTGLSKQMLINMENNYEKDILEFNRTQKNNFKFNLRR